MRFYALPVMMAILLAGCQAAADRDSFDFNHTVVLEAEPLLSANAEIADFDGDGNLDVALAVGRHWPGKNRILFGDGLGMFTRVDSLGQPADRTYSISAVDMDGDGDVDLVVSNDRPDTNYILFNDGRGGFGERLDFGDPDWPTRNSTVADVNGDGRPDILVANRSSDPRTEDLEPGSPSLGGDNYICLNESGESSLFIDCRPFPSGSATTIAASDMNGDGAVDLIVPYRDGGQSHVFVGNGVGGFSEYVPFGPADAVFRAALAVDINRDGLPDIVAISDRDRSATYFLQTSQFGFSEGVRLDDGNMIPYALEVADLDADGFEDILVGYREAPSRLFLNRATGFEHLVAGDSLGAAYGFGTGDVDGNGNVDIALARSGASDVLFLSR